MAYYAGPWPSERNKTSTSTLRRRIPGNTGSNPVGAAEYHGEWTKMAVDDMFYRALRALGDKSRFEFMLHVLDSGRVKRPGWLGHEHMTELKAGGLIITKGAIFSKDHDPDNDYVQATVYGAGLVRAVFEFEMNTWQRLREKLEALKKEKD